MGALVGVGEVLLEMGLSSSSTDEERAIVQMAIQRAEGSIRRHLHYDPSLKARTEFYPQGDLMQAGRDRVWETSESAAILRNRSEAATSELQLQNLPVRSSVEMRVFVDYDGRSGSRSGAFATDTEKTIGDDFWPNYDKVDSDGNGICSDGIVRSVGMWPTTPGAVKVIYTAGYSDDELRGQDSLIDASPIWETALEESVRRARQAFLLKKKTGVGFAAGPFSSESLGDYSYSADTSAITKMFGGLYSILPISKERMQEFINYGWSLSS